MDGRLLAPRGAGRRGHVPDLQKRHSGRCVQIKESHAGYASIKPITACPTLRGFEAFGALTRMDTPLAIHYGLELKWGRLGRISPVRY